jgi:ring-1,2-phenylacetyl-CoA epoxidase subunit PaaC
LGYSEESLIWESDPDDFQHSSLVELPFEQGNWAGAILRAFLYDTAEEIRLAALEESTYRPIRDRTSRIQGEEEYHLEHAVSWLERLAADDEGRERLQAALEELYPYALTLFEPVGDVESDIVELGIRSQTLGEMRTEWENDVAAQTTALGLDIPDVEPASPAGRDGRHTDHWHDLFEEMTSTYRNLGRNRATTIMTEENNE